MASNKKAQVVVPIEFPEDVLSEILSGLCVKDLTRFKCVCKTWLHLISSQDFIQLHLNKSMFKVLRISEFIMCGCPRLFPPKSTLTEDFLVVHNSNLPKEVVDLSIVSYPRFNMRFIGSCDGLVCLYNLKHGIMHIWNPTIRKSTCMYIKRPPHRIIYCFWFGRHDDEYKVVMVTKTHMHLIRPHIDKFSWKSTQEVGKKYYYYEDIGTLFNGNVHWSAHYTFEAHPHLLCCTIVCYDLGKEAVGEIPLPEMGNNNDHNNNDNNIAGARFKLGEVNGCLSTMFCNGNEVELWVMKEYGVKESWTKLMTLQTDSAFYNHYSVRIEDEPELVLSHPAKVKSPIYGKVMYVQSLVSPVTDLNLAISGP